MKIAKCRTMYPAYLHRVNEKKRNIYQAEYAVDLKKEKTITRTGQEGSPGI